MTINLFYARPPFKYIIGALAYTLNQKGYATEIHETVPENKKDEFWIGIWNGCKDFPKRYIAYNFEPLAFGDWPRTCMPYLKSALEVWDYSTANLPILAKHAIPYKLVPAGYSEYYEQSYEENLLGKSLSEDIDILFYATPTPRREYVIASLKKAGLKITWLGRDKDDNPTTTPKRDEYIARAKIILSVVHNEPRALNTNDFARLSYLIANKKFIVCESVGDIVEQSWRHIVKIVTIHEIENMCRYYLANKEEAEHISGNAYRHAVDNFNLKNMVPLDSIAKLYQPDLI